MPRIGLRETKAFIQEAYPAAIYKRVIDGIDPAVPQPAYYCRNANAETKTGNDAIDHNK